MIATLSIAFIGLVLALIAFGVGLYRFAFGTVDVTTHRFLTRT